MKRITVLSAVVAVCLLVGGSSAQAVTFTDSNSASFTNLDIGSNLVPDLTLDQFDTGLGTLTKVILKIEADTSGGTIQWDNEAENPSTVTLGIGGELTVTGPDALVVVTIPLQLNSGSVSADEVGDGGGDYAGPDAFAVSSASGSDTDEEFLTTGFDSYKGTGTFNVSVESLAETFLSTSGGFGPINPDPGIANGTVTVIYEYIPEPGTMAMLAVGGIGMLLRRRRK